MVEGKFNLELNSIDSSHKVHDSRARSHRITEGFLTKPNLTRCKSQEKGIFDHNDFIHSRIIKASHDIPHPSPDHPEHKHLHQDHSRTVVMKKRVVSENILLDSFPT